MPLAAKTTSVADKEDKVMDDTLANAILESLAPIEPDQDRANVMRAQILDRVRDAGGSTPRLVTVANTTDKWIEISPGNFVKILRTDDDSMSMLVKLEPGTTFPAHSHPADEETYVVEGEAWFGDIHLSAGDYHLAPTGTEHGEVRTEVGCTLFIRKAAE